VDEVWTAGDNAGADRWRREMTRSVLLAVTVALGVGWLTLDAHAQPPVRVWESGTPRPSSSAPPSTSIGTPAPAAPTPDAIEIPPAPDPAADLGGYARAVVDAVRGGRWLVTFGLLLVGLVAAARWGLGRVVPWFLTDRGGTILAAVTAFVAVVGSGLAAGIPLGVDLLGAAVAAGAGAIGLFTGAKRLIRPSDQRAV
jgi:hypothetical protein